MLRNKTAIQKIGVLRALNLGDMLCSTPSLRALRNEFPNAHITLLGLPWSIDFQKKFPHLIDNVIVFPKHAEIPEATSSTENEMTFLKNAQQENFDLLLQLHGNGTVTNPLVRKMNAKQTAGFYKEGTKKPGELFFPYPEDMHEVHRMLQLLKHLAIPNDGDEIEHRITLQDFEQYSIISKAAKISPYEYIVIHPGANEKKRQWDVEKFAFVSDHFSKLGYKVVVTGTKNDQRVVQDMLNLVKYPVVNLTEQTTLGTLGALIQNASLLITNDTGVSHVASACKTKSIIIFSPYSDPERWAPIDTHIHRVITPEGSKSPKNVILEGVRLLMPIDEILSFKSNYLEVTK